MVRIIAGQWGGRRLQAPAGMRLRPTSDKLRETLGNIWAERWPGAWLLDLYAGTGAIGLEGLSRGAERVWWVEQQPAALAALEANRQALGAAGVVIARPVLPALKRLAHDAETAAEIAAHGGLDLIFLDPPYAREIEYGQVLEFLSASALAGIQTQIAAEHAAQARLAEAYGELRRTRCVRQGGTHLSFFQRR